MQNNSSKILMLYLPLEDPIITDTFQIIDCYIRHGCNYLEISLPCTNPVLDGTVIRNSMKRILNKHQNDFLFPEIKRIREEYPQLGIQLMAYQQIIQSYGYQRFTFLCKDAGVSSVLSPDANQEEITELEKYLSAYQIPCIHFVPYEITTMDNIHLKKSTGYLFQQSTSGKTGGSTQVSGQIQNNIQQLRNADITIPVIVGFGISNAEQVSSLLQMGASGAVVGSALIDHIEKNDLDEYLSQFDELFL